MHNPAQTASANFPRMEAAYRVQPMSLPQPSSGLQPPLLVREKISRGNASASSRNAAPEQITSKIKRKSEAIIRPRTWLAQNTKCGEDSISDNALVQLRATLRMDSAYVHNLSSSESELFSTENFSADWLTKRSRCGNARTQKS
jgi:hypothetical protein